MCQREEGKSSRELFEKARVNAVHIGYSGILGGLVGLYRNTPILVPNFTGFEKGPILVLPFDQTALQTEKYIFELIAHFIADTDTDENYFRICSC